MMIDIQKPKQGSGATLFTLARSLTAEEIAARNPSWYAPEALRFDDCLLADDWDSPQRIAILDPRYDYETLELNDALEKYRKILSDRKSPKDDRITANCILDLIIGNHLIEDRKISDEITRLLADTSSELGFF